MIARAASLSDEELHTSQQSNLLSRLNFLEVENLGLNTVPLIQLMFYIDKVIQLILS